MKDEKVIANENLNQTEEPDATHQDKAIDTDIEKNIQRLTYLFTDSVDFIKRKFKVGKNKETTVYLGYIDGLVDRNLIETQLISQIMVHMWEVETIIQKNSPNVFSLLKEAGITTADVAEVTDFSKLVHAILAGDTAFIVDGCSTGLVIATRGWLSRGVTTADTEVVIQGSKEAFTEMMRMNTMLIRRRIRDTNMKVFQLRLGTRSETDVALMYITDIVRPEILAEVKKRISSINIDAILDIGYVDHLIEDNWYSPFPQGQITERPDVASAALLEGRLVITVDNCPFVLIVPSTIGVFFNSPDDYYQKWQIMSLTRILRYTAGFFAVSLPALYLAITIFHPNMVPTILSFRFSSARQNVPFPALLEFLLMDMFFELLRESGIRLPGAIGSTMGIVGGIVLGQAAVEAGIVSPIAVIVVSITGVCGFAIPHISLVSSFRLVKYFLLIASAFLGLFGFWVASIFVLLHLVSLKSFGIPYMFPYTSGDVNDYSDLKDSIIRMPLFKMKKRPIFANNTNTNRCDNSNFKNIHTKE
jgi:spore germination protein